MGEHLAAGVFALHLLWVVILVGGVFLARARPGYLVFHWVNISATAISQVLWGACPLTLIELGLRGSAAGSFTAYALSLVGIEVPAVFAPHVFILAVALATVRWGRKKPTPQCSLSELAEHQEALYTLAALAERALAFIQMRPGYADQVDFISELTRTRLLKEEILGALEVMKWLRGEREPWEEEPSWVGCAHGTKPTKRPRAGMCCACFNRHIREAKLFQPSQGVT